jgi:hypothetical protein
MRQREGHEFNSIYASHLAFTSTHSRNSENPDRPRQPILLERIVMANNQVKINTF